MEIVTCSPDKNLGRSRAGQRSIEVRASLCVLFTVVGILMQKDQKYGNALEKEQNQDAKAAQESACVHRNNIAAGCTGHDTDNSPVIFLPGRPPLRVFVAGC